MCIVCILRFVQSRPNTDIDINIHMIFVPNKTTNFNLKIVVLHLIQNSRIDSAVTDLPNKIKMKSIKYMFYLVDVSP